MREWATYRRLLGYVRPYAGRLAMGLLFGLLYSAANGLMIGVIRGGVKQVFGDVRPEDSGAALLLLAVFFPGVGLWRGLSDFLATYYVRWVGMRVVMDLRNKVFDHLHELPVGRFTQSRTGDLISRVTGDTGMIEGAVSSVLADLAKEPFTLVSMVFWIFVVDARLAAVSLVVFPICILPVALFGRKVRRYSKQAQERIADVISILQETITGVRIVKAFGMERYESRRFSERTQAFFGRVIRVERARAIVEPIIVFIAACGLALVLLYVRWARMSVDDFLAFAAALFMMYEPVKKLSKIHVYVQQSSAAADRVFELLDAECEVKERAGALDLGAVSEIRFEDVRFSYGEGWVIDGVSFAMRAGERVAVVGGSGAGKSTLANLLPRFYEVGTGSIQVNGRDIREYTLTSLRRSIGLVTQETFLFNDTVAGNIAYGTNAAERSAIEGAARLANAHEFILAMPNGYDTQIGELGLRLSGGQRQRLAIARAILRNPPILILDEATSALDTESERLVQEALNRLMKGRTVLAIAHRLSTISNCDRILVLDQGRIAEQGTHAELLARGGNYKRLYDMQFA